MLEISQFSSYLKTIGVSQNKIDKIMDYLVNWERNLLFNLNNSIKLDENLINAYTNQIVNMFKEHPDIDENIYKNYIKFILEKLELKGVK